jgi:hypothetical protein
MICAHTAIMPHISILRRDIDDRLSDLACARRSRRHRNIGGTLVSIDIIQLIPRPKHDDVQTDFPTIAFRSRHEPVTDPIDAVPDKRDGSADREA